LLHTIYNLIIILAESENVFKRNDKTKCAVGFSIRYTCLIAISVLPAAAVTVVSLFHNWLRPCVLAKSSGYLSRPNTVVERWNRTMREKMFKYLSANSTRRYIDVLDALTDQYNNTVHSSIRMTPVEASLKKNKAIVWRNLHPDFSTTEDNVPKFSVGDKVRITKGKKTFKKGYNHRGGLKKYSQFLKFNTRILQHIK